MTFLISESLKDRITEADLLHDGEEVISKNATEQFSFIMNDNNNRLSFPINTLAFKKQSINLTLLCYSHELLSSFFNLHNDYLLEIICNDNVCFQKKHYKKLFLKSIEESLTRKCFFVTIIITE